MNRNIHRCIWITLLLIFYSGCSKALIRSPLAFSNDRWHITLDALTLGPHQYNTAVGYWEPRRGKRFVWATVRIRNGLKTDQVFLLDRIMLTAGGNRKRPFIIDMNSALTMRANPEPRLAPGETVTRRLIYMMPDGVVPERMTYEKTGIAVPAMRPLVP